ncbi:3-deoxy-7-phosphoheptulonate synthase [Natranaerofaba carboxydovora]|uniref:3-deoxy-7-phosphoheptulonate synthase n=1 Tax=Natranaerofaba carboxydovora TaxID=2742683 RepID=UPI001F13C4EE|nr:3-deoxy-7-phosphoheptulonate synthase [Natranaerofaba carboxydovora]UMZ72924.1 Phospho-2-dehydro-3-deoxyheptonate aldolase [Natranaerofaba carboxydovora]
MLYVSRDFQSEDSQIKIGPPGNETIIGGDNFTVMAGPCAIEDEKTLLDTAFEIKKTGCDFLRGGAFKPRSSPYSFQGLGVEGLKILQKAGSATGLKTITEVMEPENVETVAKYADMLQVGSRNMQNFSLLKEIGRSNKPVLLKRGISATIEEWLMAAEYILAEGNFNIVFCERGIRTFETYTRNTLDLSAVPIIKLESHLPIIVDPSHGTGNKNLIPSMSSASLAAGADGLMLEVHPHPERALSDGKQSLTINEFNQLLSKLNNLSSGICQESKIRCLN